jgi:ubiquinone/menaquinone biosynthesis C-methylase UbiE
LTGTGLAAIAALCVVGPRGFVHGIDIAERMVSEAQLAAAAAAGVTNIAFDVADAGRLPFERASFDVTCSSAMIYLPLPGALHEWSRVLRPAGIAAFSTLQQDAPRAGVVFREVAGRRSLRSARDKSNAPCKPQLSS